MVKIDHEKCLVCGECVEACTNEVLVIKNNMLGEPLRVAVENPDDCEECGDCEMACPNDAITVEEE